MGSLDLHLPVNLWLPVLAAILLIFILARLLQRGAGTKQKSAELLWFSNLHFLSRALAESRDPRQMTEEALHGTLEMLGTTEGYILLHMSGSEELNHASAQGFSAAAVHRLGNEPLRAYVASCAQRWGGLMVFPDLLQPELVAAWQRDPVFREFRRILIAEGLRTLVVVGLQMRERCYGALLVGSRKRRVFQPQELRMALAIGNQVSVALENWSLYRAAERHSEELHILHRVGEALRSTFDLKTQVETLRRELRGLLGTTNFSLALQDSPEGPLETVVAFESGEFDTGLPGAQASGLGDYIVRARSPLLISGDVLGTARRLGISPVDPRIRTWCGVPIHFSDGSMGVLALADFEREHAITDRQFELIQVLANEAAGAIENARLFHKEQRRASHLALLNELGQKATAVLNPQELLASICQQVQSAFDYGLTRIEVVSEERDELVVEAQAGYGTDLLGRRVRFGEGLAGIAADSGEPVLANAVAREPRYVAIRPGVRSALSLPLKYRDQILGVLSLESQREQAFSQQDVLTLRTLADQLAIGLHNARAYQTALEQAITDGLTGLKTHRYFMEALDREWRHATRSGQHFSLIMVDLDGFKQVNDRQGHLEGDKILTAVANLLADRVRQSNVVARYGGDEFAILMPETKTEQAEILAERLRAALETDPVMAAHQVTGSFGIATFPVHGPTQEEILRVADSGMYLAKHQKGNLVRVASLAPQSGQADLEQQLLEAYLGVAVKRMFSTGPEAFNQYLHRFERVMQGAEGESPSLLDTVTALAFAIDAKDHYTQGHSQSVSRLAAQIARHMGLSDAEVEEVRLAGILHDIGKIGVPESVLHKPGLLTQEEYEVMKSHAALGEKILEPLKVKAIAHIRRMVRHHHEHFDGRGYPDRLQGDQIPIGARLLSVADCFDTMVSDRAYKKGRTVDDAVAELRRCCGTQFDPSLVKAFVQSLETLGDPRKRETFEQAAN